MARIRSHADYGPKTRQLDIDINERLNFWPNNKAIALMVKWFGPMKGTFQGAIPTKEEAFQSIRDVPKTVASEKFHCSGAKTGMPQKPRLIQQIENAGGSAIMSPLTYGKVGWTTWKEDTLIVGNDAAVWLIDKKRGRLYGGYTP